MVVEPVPEPERCAPTAFADTPVTPEYAEAMTPPSETDVDSVARTISRVPWSGFGSG